MKKHYDSAIKAWLTNMVNDEIDETKGTISNERAFQKGCDSAEQVQMCESNIRNLEEYIEALEDVLGYIAG